MTRRERSIYFGWLEVMINEYESKVGDGKGIEVWNWMIERFKPDGFEKIEEDKIGDNT